MNVKLRHHPGPLQENWTYRFQDPETQRGLWLQFRIVISRNGFQRQAEIWAIVFEKGHPDVTKTLFKQTFDLKKWIKTEDQSIRLGD